METENTFHSQRGGEHARRSSAEAHDLPSTGQAVRLQRVGEYEESGVARSEKFAAFLAAIQSELFRIAISLEDAVQQSFRHGRCGADGIRAADPPMTRYLRAARQIEQNARLEIHARNVGSRHH